MISKAKCILSIKVVSLQLHCNDSRSQGATIWVTRGGKETSVIAVRPCGMEISPSGALDIKGSLHLTIGYLLKGEWEDLEFNSYG